MESKLSLVEHLEELRTRIIKSLIFIVIATCFAYSFVNVILLSLVKPIGKLVFIAPHEAFITRIKISFFVGLFLSSPFVLFEIWKFISLALKPNEKKYILIFGPLSLIIFFIGASFGYFIVVPIGIKFLLSFATDVLSPMITISKYVTFVGTLVLGFGVIFELPLAVFFLTEIGLIAPKFLSSKRRHAVVLIFIVAAILTPPDVITQLLMALPLLVLYEISILFSKFAYQRRKKMI